MLLNISAQKLTSDADLGYDHRGRRIHRIKSATFGADFDADLSQSKMRDKPAAKSATIGVDFRMQILFCRPPVNVAFIFTACQFLLWLFSRLCKEVQFALNHSKIHVLHADFAADFQQKNLPSVELP